MRLRILLLVPMLALLFSCDRARLFEENQELKSHQWAEKEMLSFTFEVKDADKPYDLFVNVRNSADYPYHNLYVKHFLFGADGKQINTALHNLYLSDPKTGKPKGKGLGDIRDHQIRFFRNVKFTRPGTYTVKFQQYMRVDPLPGIMAIGLRVAEAQVQ